MESDTMILLLITISLIVVVVYNQFINCDKEEFKNNINTTKRISVITDSLGDNSINKKDLYKYNKIYRKNICLDNKNKKKYKKKIEIVENEIDSLDNLLNNNDMKSLNSIDNNTLSDIETFVR
jgi:hypothetical protein